MVYVGMHQLAPCSRVIPRIFWGKFQGYACYSFLWSSLAIKENFQLMKIREGDREEITRRCSSPTWTWWSWLYSRQYYRRAADSASLQCYSSNELAATNPPLKLKKQKHINFQAWFAFKEERKKSKHVWTSNSRHVWAESMSDKSIHPLLPQVLLW